MMEYFVVNRKFIEELLKENIKVNMPTIDWNFIENFVQAFRPVFCATNRLQNESLIIGDFFFIWLDARM